MKAVSSNIPILLMKKRRLRSTVIIDGPRADE